MSFGRSAFGRAAFGRTDGVDASVVSPVAALLADPLAERETLLYAQPWNPATSSRVGVYLSGGGYASGIGDTWPEGTACAHQLFRARLSQPLRYEARVASAGRLTGDGAATYGDAEVIVADGDPGMTALMDYDWKSAPVQAYQGLPSWPLCQFSRVFNGTAADLKRGVEVASIQLRDVTEVLRQAPAQRRLYRGLGAAWRGNGTSDYASGTVPCPAGSMALEGWIRPRTLDTTQRVVCGWRHTVGAVTPGARRLFFISGSSNRLVWRLHNDAGDTFDCTYTDPIPANANTHFYAELDIAALKARLYINAAATPVEISVTGTWATVWSTFEVLRRPEASLEYCPADIDELRIWGSSVVPRSQASIAQLKDRECLGTESGLQDVFHFNEATGSTAYTGTATGRTLALNGGQWVSLLEGGSDLSAKPRIKVGGVVLKVKPVSVDGLGLVFELHAGPVQSLLELTDAGLGSFTSDGTVSDVYTWTPVSGKYVTCQCSVAAGETTTLLRFGSAPVGTIQATIQGDNAGGYVSDAPSLAQRLWLQETSSTNVDSGSIAKLALKRGYACGYVLYPDSSKTVWSLSLEILAWVNAWVIASREGLVTVGLLGSTDGAVAAIGQDDVDLDGIEDLGILPAIRRHRIGYARYGSTLNGGDVQNGVTRTVREDLGQEYRFERSPDTAVASDTTAEDLEVLTGIYAQADAFAEATARQAFRSVPHRGWRLPLVTLPHQFTVGQQVSIALPVKGLEAAVGEVDGLIVDEGADVYSIEVLV